MIKTNKSFISGFLVWLLIFVLLSTLLSPIAILIGSVTSTVSADFVAGLLQTFLCPKNSTAEIITFQSSIMDEFGNRLPSTAYEMQCVADDGTIVKPSSPVYGFYWSAVLVGVVILISGLFAFFLAVPATALVYRLSRTKQK